MIRPQVQYSDQGQIPQRINTPEQQVATHTENPYFIFQQKKNVMVFLFLKKENDYTSLVRNRHQPYQSTKKKRSPKMQEVGHLQSTVTL